MHERCKKKWIEELFKSSNEVFQKKQETSNFIWANNNYSIPEASQISAREEAAELNDLLVIDSYQCNQATINLPKVTWYKYVNYAFNKDLSKS